MDDWDLQAVVRRCTVSPSQAPAATTDPFSFLTPMSFEDSADHRQFPSPVHAQTAINELEQMCKPFFPKAAPSSPPPVSFQRLRQQQQQPPPQRSSSSQNQIPRSKRRKNQQKRVMCQVPAEGLSSDMWAWRKYGQKPIKGSPYPRGYYRCSSSKGCLARKQVERSRSDPNIFVITYTSEHNHPLPTHRNSLAGSTRHKYMPAGEQKGTGEGEEEIANNASMGLSPTTPLMGSIEEGLLRRHKQEDAEEDEELLLHDMMMGEDMFMDLEELQKPTGNTSTSALDCFADHLPVLLPFLDS